MKEGVFVGLMMRRERRMSDQGGRIGWEMNEMNEWMGCGGQSMRGRVYKWRQWREVGWSDGGTAKVKEKRDKTQSERVIRVLFPASSLVCVSLSVPDRCLACFPTWCCRVRPSLPVCRGVINFWSNCVAQAGTQNRDKGRTNRILI